ncbi:MAG TPA: hypothetical protein PLV65_09360 [Tenuifilaceae bacterium]|jgi:site-specific DNA-adenine methylase|nr:hypothetical protein [Tenuifilaceae bacterium]
MSIEQKSIHTRLKSKIEELISAYEKLKEENSKLKEQMETLQNVMQEREIAYIELDKKYNQQQLARAFVTSSDDTHDAKVKVDLIVREIDQCIALLNR